MCVNLRLLLIHLCAFSPQEAKDEALQALPAAQRTQTDRELKERHDHEGREHERNRHAIPQRHSKSLSPSCSALDTGLLPVWGGARYVKGTLNPI